MKNKKGQLFTILVILIISLMFLSFEVYSTLRERESVKERVSSMDSFLFSVEQNLERQMYISGFRILFLAENEITLDGNYINDLDGFFQEAFFNGTVEGVSKEIMQGATYDYLVNSIIDKAKKINVDVEMSNPEIVVNQEDPWHVKFTLVSDFIMADKQNLAQWDRRQNISTLIPVVGFEDPLFTVNSYAKVSRKINQTIFEGDYVSGGDVSNLILHVNNGYYSANTDAPSFLKRFEGDLSADENGIESFVVIPEFSQQGLPTNVKTCIDYIYFSANNPTYYSVLGMPTWFNVDNEDDHLNKYQVP